MGFALVDRVFDLPDLSPSERLVLMAMARRADDVTGDSAFMAVASIAAVTGLGESTVKSTRAKLVERGLICAVGWVGRGGRSTREYRLDLKRGLAARPQGANSETPGGQQRDPRGPAARPQGASSETLFNHGSDHRSDHGVSHVCAGEEPELPLGQGWHDEEQSTGENHVPQEPNPGPSQHAFYRNGQPSAETTPSIPAGRISESAPPVVSDVERALAHYAEVAPLNLRKALRGPTPARADVEAAVARYGVDAVCAAVDDARRAAKDGHPPWQWILDRLEGRTRGARAVRAPEDTPQMRGWSRSMK